MGVFTKLWTSLSDSILSFNGFNSEEIYVNDLWKICPRMYSTTVVVESDIFDQLMYELHGRYGTPEDKGNHGLIFRTQLSTDDTTTGTVTITCYPSTCTLSIQGTLHSCWVDTVLIEIGVKLRNENAAESDPDQSSLCDISATCMPTSTSTPIRTSASVQAASVSTASQGMQTSPIPTPRYVCASTQTEPSRCNCSSSKPTTPNKEQTKHFQIPRKTASRSSASCASTSAIPTSNFYSVLQVEDCDLSSDCDVSDSASCSSASARPMPKPRKHKPVPKPRKFKPIPKPRTLLPTCEPRNDSCSNSSTAVPCSSPQPKPSLKRRTVLILGDSIPKYLQGRRLSRRLKVVNRCISGSDLELWIKIAPAFVEEVQPSCVIIHCGTNNINTCFPSECLELLVKLGNIIKEINSDIHVAVSSLTNQEHYGISAWLKEYNSRLADVCDLLHWTYIDNSNIGNGHLARDKLHLNRSGTRTLAMNFISFLRIMTETLLII